MSAPVFHRRPPADPSATSEIAELYDRSAARWVRRAPSSLSDFTARPAVFEMCDPVAGREVLDLGCGEGYCSRELARRGARAVFGLDLSSEMIEAARAEEQRAPLGIEYSVGDASRWSDVPAQSFDVIVAVFLFNYMSCGEMLDCMRLCYTLLAPGGRFVFSVPHPCLPLVRDAEPPFYFDAPERGYFDGRGEMLAGEIWRRDGQPLGVRAVHKTFADYFDALRTTGFRTVLEVRELGVTDALINQDPVFFGPLAGLPLHVAFSVQP